MATNKIIALRTVSEFMGDYVPTYQPFYPLFMNKSQSYSEEVGQIEFRRVNTIGDIRARHISPKDTTIKEISVGTTNSTFHKYFLANRYVQSQLQDQAGVEDVVAQVLDEHQKQADDLLVTGDNGINNGLYTSADPNYVLKDSVEVAKGTANDHLIDLHGRIVSSATEANLNAGQKVVIVYGATATAKFNSLHPNLAPFKRVLSDVLGDNYRQVELPSAVTPAGANGFIVANLDQTKLHYTTLPKLRDQGVNEEHMYAWFNFLMGSMMLECLAKGAIIRQPVTFQA